MAAAVLALAAALSYGLSDFFGGILSKTRSEWMVTTASQLTAAAATAIIALTAPGDPGSADFAWGAAAGIAGAIGISALYRGLNRGRIGVVAPISGTGAALVPVIVGLATGDEPSTPAWIGIVLAFPAIILVPQAGGKRAPAASGAGYGVIAGLGFGALFALIGQIGEDAGFLPLALTQLVVAATVASVAIALRQPWVPRGRGLAPVFAFGLLGTAALVCFLLATRAGMLTVVSVIAALYPASTVVMAAVVLRENIGRVQSVGLGLAAIAVVLVTVGEPSDKHGSQRYIQRYTNPPENVAAGYVEGFQAWSERPVGYRWIEMDKCLPFADAILQCKPRLRLVTRTVTHP